VNDRAQECASGDWFESCLERLFAGLENFESAAPVGAAGEFQKGRVAAGRTLQSGACVAEEFVIDEDFGAVGIRGNSDCADAIGADDEEIFDGSEDSAPSLARGWPVV
jgi:hypothetical protein